MYISSNGLFDVASSLFSQMLSFRASGGEHQGDDLLIFPGERAGNRRHAEPPHSAHTGHDLHGPGLRREGSQRVHPKGAARGRGHSRSSHRSSNSAELEMFV